MPTCLPNQHGNKGETIQYTGVSTDDKPVPAPEGATLHCVDTGEQWVHHNGVWSPDLRFMGIYLRPIVTTQ